MDIGLKGKYSAGMGRLDNGDHITGSQEKSLNAELARSATSIWAGRGYNGLGLIIVGCHGPSTPQPRRAKKRRGRKNRAALVGMTDKEENPGAKLCQW